VPLGQVLEEGLRLMGPGLQMTLAVSVTVMLIGLAIGFAAGLALIYGPMGARLLVRAYVDLVRGLPILILIFLVFYGLPAAGINVPDFVSGCIALGIWVGAHVCEILRGGISAVPRGQTEAATALGLGFRDRLRHVIIPQSIRPMVPPLVNTAIENVKASSLVSLVSIAELTRTTEQVVSRVQLPVPLYALAALMYFVVNYAISLGGSWLERRYEH
jgi:polar amino acid transport system permease protein